MTSIASYEPLTDDIIIKLLRVLNERFIRTGKTCPIDQWFQYLAFDVVSMVTMSRPMGFVEQGGDVDGLLAQLETEFSYRLQTGIFPVWDTIMRKNKFVSWLSRNTVSPFLKRSREILDDRVKALHERDAEKYSDEMGRDFVSRFFEQKEKNPTEVSDNMLLMYVTQNIVAGSDTTAIVLRSILYRLMKNPNALATLRAELDAANPTFPIPYSVAYKLPYLTALVKECLRLHPIGGSLLLERIVPSTGLKVLDSDVVLPGGTIVGSSGWMTAFDKRVFGEDAGVFRPERWLKGEHETHEAFKERLSMMNSSDLSFGKGSRLCLGKHIAELELFKVLPTLVALLDIEMDPPGKEWDVEYLFFAKQSGMDVKIKWRKGVVQEEIIG
ncbi:MAG: hypothetical protein M1821_003274 [Bathelium mastoideum]|nr:MAG: hypothetical protein M1821_003274 [Bathelium mastoideum]